MYTFVNSIVEIQVAQKELEKYSTEAEQRQAMEKIQSKTIISSCRNILYLIGAITSAGLIQWALQ